LAVIGYVPIDNALVVTVAILPLKVPDPIYHPLVKKFTFSPVASKGRIAVKVTG
jgi:hypothetical protein